MIEDTGPKAAVGRRQVLRAAGTAVVAVVAGGLLSRGASATPEAAAEALAKLTGGATAKPGRISLKLPQIAEDGAVVPLTVRVDSPMTESDHVKSIHVVAERNPNPDVVSFRLTPAAGKAEVTTRVRLGKTQNVVAVAVMSDGSVYRAQRMVKVTLGGCGG